MCSLERMITYYLDYKLTTSNEKFVPAVTATDRVCNVAIRTVLYGIGTTLRLLYMLVVMYFNTGLFFTVVCLSCTMDFNCINSIYNLGILSYAIPNGY